MPPPWRIPPPPRPPLTWVIRPSSMWVATPGGAKISRASASGNPRQRSETPRNTFLARCVKRMVSSLVVASDPFADWKFQDPRRAVTRPDRDSLRQPPWLSNSRTRMAQMQLAARSLGLANGRPTCCVESKRPEFLLAGVPEALTIAWVGVVPAQSRRRRLARVGDGRARGQDADRSAGRDRAARTPVIPVGSRPAAAIDPCAAIDAAPVRAATIAANGSAAMVDAAAW